jgi:hypothetical protein
MESSSILIEAISLGYFKLASFQYASPMAVTFIIFD